VRRFTIAKAVVGGLPKRMGGRERGPTKRGTLPVEGRYSEEHRKCEDAKRTTARACPRSGSVVFSGLFLVFAFFGLVFGFWFVCVFRFCF